MRPWMWVGAWGWVMGCSLAANPDTCGSDQACSDAFGLGSTCGDEGFCTEFVANVRCADTEPEDLLTRRDAYSDRVVLGALFNGLTDQPQIRSAKLAVKQVNEVGSEGSPEL